jgi:phenylpropionate dioxygenase-like ring-hydroxylating dioxygenase large terminal subunit
MMCIDSRAYHAQDVFEEEITRLFEKRLFVGTEAEFADVDAYKTVQLGREPITIRRTVDGIRAFSNVCLHRNALIDPPGCGVRAFRCPYHAWAYGPDGALTHTPKVDPSCLERTQLRRWDVGIRDGLVFIGRKSPEIGEVASIVRELKAEYVAPFHYAHLDHGCNWKLLVENVLEGYHISAVHSRTFVPTGITSSSEYSWGAGKYTNYNTVVANGNASTRRLQALIKGTRPQYSHAYVFPNMFLSNGNDHIGFIGHFIPTSPEQTRLEWCLFEQPLLRTQSDGVRKAIRDAAIEFTMQTLSEDKAIVESCHVGLKSAEAGYVLLANDNLESRVIDFQSTYLRHIKHA